MADYFFESSALAKYYHEEVGTPEVVRLVEDAASTCYISRLASIEIHSVFAGKVRTRHVTEEAVEGLRQRFLNDILQRLFLVTPMIDMHYQEAARLIRVHGVARGLRTLDAIQLAVALDLNRRTMLDQFVCSDLRLFACTEAEGLPCLNPEVAV